MEQTYFKLTTETKVNIFGITLFRLELTIDCKHGKSGDKGGWIDTLLTPSGNARVSGDAWVSGDACVSGNAWVSGDAWVYGNACVSGNAQVYGDAQVYGNAWDESPLQIQGARHFFNICAKGKIKIGCMEYTFSEWELNFEKIGKSQNYTERQIKEYHFYIKLAIELSNLK